MTKNMHSMLFLKPPACSRKYPYPPPHRRDLPHATPPSPPPSFRCFRKAPVSIHTLLPNWLKKNSPYPHPRRDVPHAPLPYPFGFSRGAPVPKHTPSCCPDSYCQHKSSNACHTFYRVSWISSSSEKTFLHVGKICHTKIFFVCSELLNQNWFNHQQM